MPSIDMRQIATSFLVECPERRGCLATANRVGSRFGEGIRCRIESDWVVQVTLMMWVMVTTVTRLGGANLAGSKLGQLHRPRIEERRSARTG